jgi:hypothetical protein
MYVFQILEINERLLTKRYETLRVELDTPPEVSSHPSAEVLMREIINLEHLRIGRMIELGEDTESYIWNFAN